MVDGEKPLGVFRIVAEVQDTGEYPNFLVSLLGLDKVKNVDVCMNDLLQIT